jgi:undecaprenyl-diphosphatase
MLRLSIGRRPRDVVSVVLAGAVLTLCSLLAQIPAINPVEVAIFEQLGGMPPASGPVWSGLLWVGSWVGIAGATAVALYLTRVRIGLQCAGAGALTFVLARLMDWVLRNRPVPGVLSADSALRLPGPAGFAFPATHVAVAAALATIAAPYLTRGLGYLGWAVTVAVGVAEVYAGSLPLGVFAGAFLGWGVATVFRLAWGTPGRRTSVLAVHRALEQAGLAPVEVVAVGQHLLGPLTFRVTTASGETLRARAVRRMHRRAGLWHKLRRLLASVEAQDAPRLSTAHHEAEHEAFVTLLAERAGLRTPPLVLACETKHGSPLLVHRQIEGRRLTALPPSELADSVLDEIWAQVATLARARIAHHDLRAENILLDPQGRPWVLNFTFGQAGASPARTAQDLADALVSLASLVGVERTVCSACRSLSVDQLAAALVYLHPLALHRGIREQVDQGRYLFTELRETLADRIDRPIPRFRSPVRPRTVAGLLLGGGAVYLLLPQLSSLTQVLSLLRDANWWWLAAAVACGLVAIVMSAVSLLGSSQAPLPFWRTVAVQVAAAFAGRTTPGGAGFFGINIAYLERLGMRRSLAVGVTLLSLAGTSAVAAVVCVVGVLGVGASGTLRGMSIPTGWPLLVGVASALVVAGLIVGSPFGRRQIIHPSMQVVSELWSTLRQPLRAVQLFGGAFGYLTISALGLAASLAAFEPHFPLIVVLVVFVVGQTLGHLAPTPGGLGAVEGLLVAGLTAVGVSPTAAVAAVLTSRLLTYWLPVLPGIGMFRYLQHRCII